MGFLRNDAETLVPEFGSEAFPWRGGDAQTLRHFICRDAPPPPPFETIILDLDDGDQLMAAYQLPSADTKRRGCVIAVHGLNGCMDASHILWLTQSMLADGWAILRVNMRGAGPARPLARRTYNAGAGADLLPFVKWARARHPKDPVFMMAHSLGGTAALNMATDYQKESGALNGLITVGAPLDMVATAAKFHARRNWLYIRYMLGGLQNIAASVPELDPALVAMAGKVKSIYEFDDKLTAPLAGYSDANAYYRGTSVHNRLGELRMPTLVIQASNDPWIPAEPCLAQPLHTNDTAIIVTKGGGHVGFHDSALNWHVRATIAWMAARSPAV